MALPSVVVTPVPVLSSVEVALITINAAMVSDKAEEFLGFAVVVSVEAVVPSSLVAVPSSFNNTESDTGFTVIDWSIKAFKNHELINRQLQKI